MGKHYCIVNQERLRQLYSYDPDTGILMSRTYGVPVGHNHKGYLTVNLWHDGKEKRFKIHNLVWMYVYGRWPHPMIDHINRIKTDNKIANLREVTNKQNTENKLVIKTSSGLPRSGFKGVHWVRAVGRWKASIGHNGRVIYLGTFDDPQVAFEAYKYAAGKLHSHNQVTKD